MEEGGVKFFSRTTGRTERVRFTKYDFRFMNLEKE